MTPEPRIELEDEPALRLEPSAVAVLPSAATEPAAWGTAALGLSGLVVLGLGIAGLSIGNFVADQFARPGSG